VRTEWNSGPHQRSRIEVSRLVSPQICDSSTALHRLADPRCGLLPAVKAIVTALAATKSVGS
jgi:hypothetical protein